MELSYESCSDIELIHFIAVGDTAAFEMLWRRYWEELYNATYKRLKDDAQSRDVVQDLFIDLWERRERLRIENVEAYLNTAVRYKVFKLLSDAKKNIPFFEVFDTISSTALGADNVVVGKELADLAQLWFKALPKKRKQIFLMHYVENLTTKEIALKLNITQKTVQNQLGLATTSFNEQLIPLLIIVLETNSLIR